MFLLHIRICSHRNSYLRVLGTLPRVAHPVKRESIVWYMLPHVNLPVYIKDAYYRASLSPMF